jgi:hypothetical protein
MAPPITVDIMVVLLGRKAIARGAGQQARRVARLSRIQMRYASGLGESGLDRMDSVSVRVGQLVKDGAKRRRLRRSLILDKLANTNNWPSMRSRSPCDQCEAVIVSVSFTDLQEADSFAPTIENGS